MIIIAKLFYCLYSGNERELSPKRQLHGNFIRWWDNPSLENMKEQIQFSLDLRSLNLIYQRAIDVHCSVGTEHDTYISWEVRAKTKMAPTDWPGLANKKQVT